MTEIADRYGPVPGDAVLLGELMGQKAIARRIGALALEISQSRVAIALPDASPMARRGPRRWLAQASRRPLRDRQRERWGRPASLVGGPRSCYRTVITMQKLAGILCALVACAGCQKRDEASHRAGGGPGNATAQGSPPQSAEELGTPLAKIDDVTITIGEFQERINRQSPYIRARYTSLEQKKEFLDSLVRFEMLAKEAYRRGLDKDPEVVRTMKQVMIQKLMRDEFDSKVTADSVTDAEMKAYYDANLAEYVKPEEVRASAIILKNRAQADRVLLEAKGDAGKTNKGFRDLVDEVLLRRGDQAARRRPALLRRRRTRTCRSPWSRRRSRWSIPATSPA